MPSTTIESGGVRAGFKVKLSRTMLVNGVLPKVDYMLEGMLNTILQDYRSVTEPQTGRMKTNPRLVCEVYPTNINFVLVADFMSSMEALAWNKDNYAEHRFRSACERAMKEALTRWTQKDHGEAICTDQSGTIWLEDM